MGMTNEDAKKMLEAKLKCFIAETSGTNHDCNMRLCDGCALNYEQGNMGEQKEALDMAIQALKQQPSDDCISRKATIDALWKALYEYENKTEKQFIDSEELDVADWFQHRVFVQNMSDIDRQTILNMPSVTSQQTEWIPVSERLPEENGRYLVTRGLNACGDNCEAEIWAKQKTESEE